MSVKTVKVLDINRSYIFTSIDDGNMLYDVLVKHIMNKDQVIIDFKGIEKVTAGAVEYSIGKLFIEHKDKKEATLGLFATSTVILILALFLSLFVPINKKVWSTSYTLLTTGMSFMVISLLSFLTLKKPHEKWFYVFKVVGVNALGIYIFSNLLGFIFDYVKVNDFNLKYYINNGLVNMCMGEEYTASFIYSIIMLVVVWSFAFILHKKKIIIKL